MAKYRTIPKLSNERKNAFWAKINVTENKDECWEWKEYVDKNGYGRFKIGRTFFPSHRVSFSLSKKGKLSSFLVCHKCDNPKCCNPAHLFLGTQQENIDDCIAKGRYITGDKNGMVKHPELVTKGDKHHNAKFTDSQIIDIRKIYAEGKTSHKKLGKIYSVSANTIKDIVNGKTWKHLLSETA